MTSWQNDNMPKWSFYIKAASLNGKMTEQASCKMICQQNDILLRGTQWQFDEMTSWQNGKMPKWQLDKKAKWQKSKLMIERWLSW